MLCGRTNHFWNLDLFVWGAFKHLSGLLDKPNWIWNMGWNLGKFLYQFSNVFQLSR